jgi:hypothetical protein
MKTPTNPIPPAMLELMRRNFAARAKQHTEFGDERGAAKYQRLVEEIAQEAK